MEIADRVSKAIEKRRGRINQIEYGEIKMIIAKSKVVEVMLQEKSLEPREEAEK